MINRKIVALLLLITMTFSVVACKKDDENDYVHKGGSGETDENSGTESDGGDEQTGSTVYVYSTSSKTLHRESCYHSHGIDELYKKTYEGDDFSELIEKGFSFCILCCPEESEMYNESDDEIIDSGVNPEDATYVINIGTGKFHELDCRYAESMNLQHKVYTVLSKFELIEDGYSPCKTCEP